MSFDSWCDLQFVDKGSRDKFRGWLERNGFNIKAYRTNEEWWSLWAEFVKEVFGK